MKPTIIILTLFLIGIFTEKIKEVPCFHDKVMEEVVCFDNGEEIIKYGTRSSIREVKDRKEYIKEHLKD